MPPWFIDIESATEIEVKSKGTPPESRTAAAASRANSPNNALQGVTRPSVEATPMNGFAKSPSPRPSARRKARCGARSRPSTVILEGSFSAILNREGSFFVFTHDLVDRLARLQAEFRGALGRGRLRRPVHERLQTRVRLEAHFAARSCPHRVPHLLRAHADAAQQDRAARAERLRRQLGHALERLHDARDRDAGEPRLRLHRADVVAPRERLAND